MCYYVYHDLGKEKQEKYERGTAFPRSQAEQSLCNQNVRQISCNNMEKNSKGFEPSQPFLGFRWAENGFPFGK